MTTDDRIALGPVWGSDAGPTEGATPLVPGSEHDVVVVGAGIVGTTLARELAQQGARVLLVEAAAGPGTGVSGQSTAKVTVGHGLRLSEIRERHGLDAAIEYAAAATAGCAYIRARAEALPPSARAVTQHDLWSSDPAIVPRLVQHRRDAVECGLHVVDPGPDASRPVRSGEVVRYPDQLLIDPVVYVRLLAAEAAAAGAQVVYGAAVEAVESGSTVHTSAGSVTAQHVVVATHVPFPLRTLAFALVEQRRHYAVAGRVDEPVGTTYDVGGGWSTRPLERPEGTALHAVAVGPGHPTGTGDATASAHRLHAWAQETLGMQVTHAWSTQDAFSTDGLPLVGESRIGGRVWIATGFGAWGLALGTAAALDIARRIRGEETLVGSWSPVRASLVGHPGTTMQVTGRTAANLIGSVLTRDDAPHDLGPGQGHVVQEGGEHVAVSRDRDGVVRAVSARCTHLRCLVSWNAEAGSWDCGCHGSRFAPDGAVLHGPAVAPLADRAVPEARPETD